MSKAPTPRPMGKITIGLDAQGHLVATSKLRNLSTQHLLGVILIVEQLLKNLLWQYSSAIGLPPSDPTVTSNIREVKPKPGAS